MLLASVLLAILSGLTPLLADAAPSGVALGIIGIILLAMLVGGCVIAFFVIRGIVRFVRRRA